MDSVAYARTCLCACKIRGGYEAGLSFCQVTSYCCIEVADDEGAGGVSDKEAGKEGGVVPPPRRRRMHGHHLQAI
jgi:hypothetical protein